MDRLLQWIAALAFTLVALDASAASGAGAVVLHGNGETPEHVSDLVRGLQREGVVVVAPELPWSPRRRYDRSANEVDADIDAAIASVRRDGARHVYLIGQSLGAAYAVRYGGRPGVNGIVVIRPNHVPESPLFLRAFGDDIRRARELITSRGPQAIIEFVERLWGNRISRASAPASSFLSYYDSTGPMNMTRNLQALHGVMVLWIVPDSPDRAEHRAAMDLFQKLPHTPGSQLMELSVNHANAADMTSRAIVEWMDNTAAYIRTE